MDYMTMNFNRNGGSGGATNYNQLENKPQINGVTLIGNKTSADLGLMATRNVDLIPRKDSRNFIFSGGVYEADEKIKSSVEGMDTVYTEDGTPVELPSYDVIQETEMQFVPTQDLHGYDKPWAGGAGKNKLPITIDNLKAWNTSGAWNGNIYTDGGVTYTVNTNNNNVVSIKVNGSKNDGASYFICDNAFDSNALASYVVNGLPSNSGNNIKYRISNQYNFTTIQDCYNDSTIVANGTNLRFSIRIETKYNVQNVILYPMIRESTDSADYEPYSNICPISGQDNATLTDEYNNKYIASLGGTYYGGRVFFENSFYNQFWEYIASYNGETLPHEWISDRDEYIAGTTPTIGAEVAYRLDTTIGHRILVTREPLSRGEITYNGSALYISYQKDNVIGECKKFTVDEIAKLGFPQAPTTDGTYHLECSVSSGIPTITWVLNS